MTQDFAFAINRVRFDENYHPADGTRITTNFANLARGENRRANLGNTLAMIDNRFNTLVHWDNPEGNRYAVELDIVSVEMAIGGDAPFPLIEILQPHIVDRVRNRRIPGIAGNNFSSYVRDYDFSILLPRHNGVAPDDFGDLHGKLFKHFVNSSVYHANFGAPPVICLSASSSRTYSRTKNHHPVLGVEYMQDAHSATDRYFARMGLQVRFFMPRNAMAPLAFYHTGDLTGDHANVELAATISVMETFQKIYRPEIYNANSGAGEIYRPSLENRDHSVTRVVYDRVERSRMAVEQGRRADEYFMTPYQSILEQWSANQSDKG